LILFDDDKLSMDGLMSSCASGIALTNQPIQPKMRHFIGGIDAT
jgi:hypothetical protein